MPELKKVVNGDGMTAAYSYAVSHKGDLMALDLIGSDVEVKAIHATLVQRKAVKIGNISWRGLTIPSGMEVRTVRTVLQPDPLLCRWHVVPQPKEDDLSVPVYGWDEVLPAADAFIGALGRWTIWPTLPIWAESLYQLGQEARPALVTRLADSEGVDYAFSLDTAGWDEIIDRAVKEGQLPLPA